MEKDSLIKYSRNKLKEIRRIILLRYFRPYIFIHINKTGGSCIESALGLPFEHKIASDIVTQIGIEFWDRKFTFSVVRNPWDKVVSQYHYRWDQDQNSIRSRKMHFNDWVSFTYDNQHPEFYDKPKMFMPQIEWIADNKGNILVDKVIHYENLDEGFAEICAQLKVNRTLPHLKPSHRGDYRSYYNDESIEIISKRYKEDLLRFNYHF